MVLTEITIFIANTMASIFATLDAVKIDGTFSVLDIFIAISFLDMMTWFVMRVMNKETTK